MSFPNLVLEPEAEYHASAEGVPVNGNNTIKLPFKPALFEEDKLVIKVYSKGSSVTYAQPVSLDPETQELVINFTQSGDDSARVEAEIRWSASN